MSSPAPASSAKPSAPQTAAPGGGAAPSGLIQVTINGKPYAFPKGTLLIEAVRQAGHPVPYYCYHEKLAPVGACRVCMLQVEGAPVAPRGPVVTTACTTPVFEGLKIDTMAASAQEARRQVISFLLINHPLDCPICDKGGECDLQDFTLAYGPGVSRFAEQKILRLKAHSVGPFLILDQERCIMCRRCVRYEEEVLQEQNLVLKERGDHTVIATAVEGQPYAGYFSGNNTQLCPVGALTSRTYRFKARPWDVQAVATVCQQCSLGCHVEAQRRGERLVRVLWRDESEVDGGWLCDRGRYGFGHTLPEASRLRQPLLRRGEQLVPVSWAEAVTAAAEGLGQGRAAVLGGGRLLDEEARLVAEFARTVLRTGDLDWRVGAQGVASPVALGLAEAVPTDLDAADLVVLVDTSLEEEVPVLDLRLRRAVRRGRTQVLDLGPVRHFRFGGRWLACGPGELPQLVRAQGAAVGAAQAAVVVWNGRGGTELAAAVAALAGHGAKVLMPGEFPNARGAEAAGLLPDLLPGYHGLDDAAVVEAAWGAPVAREVGRDARGILEAAASGAVHGLYLVGANPLRSFPDGSLALQALERVPFLVVQDLFLTEAAEHADVVLPAQGWLEKAGQATNLSGRVQPVASALRLHPGGPLSDGEIVLLLAQARGRRLSGAPVPPAAAPARPTLPRAPAEAPAPLGALRVVAAERLYSGGGCARFDPHLAAVREEAVARVHPTEAARAGCTAGEWVHLRGTATLRARLRLDSAVMPGVVAVAPHALGTNRLGPWAVLEAAREGVAQTAGGAAG